jgi:hypothetical protein
MFIVGRKYRTNPLSRTPGGFTVGILQEDGRKYYYNRVKNTKLFIAAAKKNGAKKGWVVGSDDTN